MQWARHVEMMADDRLPMCQRQSYVRRAGGDDGPMLRRADCVKRDVKKAGEEEDWKKKTRARGGGNRLRWGGEEVRISLLLDR